MLTVRGENDFIREYSIDGQAITDSKYRTIELPFRANYFIARWNDADATLQNDMVTALEEFPHRRDIEAKLILQFLQSADANAAARARDLMQRQRGQPSAKRSQMYVEVVRDVMSRGDSAWTFVGENHWFQVFQSIAEVEVREKPAFREDPPSNEDLMFLAASLPEGPYKWRIETLCQFQDWRTPSAGRPTGST